MRKALVVYLVAEPETPELRALLDDPASRAANYLSALAVLGILALMAFKP